MKKLIMIMMTAGALTAVSCGDGQNSARESGNEGGTDNTEVAEPDTTSMESDTTSTQDMNQRDQGASDGTDTDSRNQRDTIQ
jgi:hypothetical protein